MLPILIGYFLATAALLGWLGFRKTRWHKLHATVGTFGTVMCAFLFWEVSTGISAADRGEAEPIPIFCVTAPLVAALICLVAACVQWGLHLIRRRKHGRP